MRIKPVLTIQGGKLDAFSIARTKKQGIEKMKKAVENDIIKRFGGMENMKNIHMETAYTQDSEAGRALIEEVKAYFQVDTVDCQPLPLSIACHIGPGALAIACCHDVMDCLNRE